MLRRVGGTPLAVWRVFWLGGITPWLLTTGIMWWGRRKELRLCTTDYLYTNGKRFTAQQLLPGGPDASYTVRCV